jgi:hypothetical protein
MKKRYGKYSNLFYEYKYTCISPAWWAFFVRHSYLCSTLNILLTHHRHTYQYMHALSSEQEVIRGTVWLFQSIPRYVMAVAIPSQKSITDRRPPHHLDPQIFLWKASILMIPSLSCYPLWCLISLFHRSIGVLSLQQWPRRNLMATTAHLHTRPAAR